MLKMLKFSTLLATLTTLSYCVTNAVQPPVDPPDLNEIGPDVNDVYEVLPGQGDCLIDDGTWNCVGQNQDTCLTILNIPANAAVGDPCGIKKVFQNTTPPKVKRVSVGYYKDSPNPWDDVCYTETECKIERLLGVKTCATAVITFHHVPRVIVNYCDPCPVPVGPPDGEEIGGNVE